MTKTPVDVADVMFKPVLIRAVRAIVTAVHAAGSSDTSGFGKTRDEAFKSSRRVELSLIPEKVNEGVAKVDLKAGFVRLHSGLVPVFH